jgi:hypothetical protein
MPTTIFTGHTLNLTDIVSVGPVMQLRKYDGYASTRRTLFIEIFCKHGVTLKHDAYVQNVFSQPTQEEYDDWDKQFQALTDKRFELIEQWGQALELSI